MLNLPENISCNVGMADVEKFLSLSRGKFSTIGLPREPYGAM
jgi:hypothetical protein